MKRCFAGGLLLPAICLLIAMQACGRGETAAEQPEEDERRRTLRSFWQTYQEATRLRTGGNISEAVRRYREALGFQPDHEDSLYYLATCYAELGDYRAAEDQYERLVALNPSSHRAHFQLGSLLSTPVPGAHLDMARARDLFLRNVEINREESGPFLRLGRLAAYVDRLDEARRYFDTAAGFQSPEGMFLSASVRFLQGDLRGARRLLERVLEINRHEQKISGRGVHSEGDVRASSGSLNPMERAGIQSLVYLYWVSRRTGGYPDGTPQEFRLEPRPVLDSRVRFGVPSMQQRACSEPAWNCPASVRDLWDKTWQGIDERRSAWRLEVDLDGDGDRERIEAGNAPLPVRISAGSKGADKFGEGLRTVVAVEARDFDGDGAVDLLLLEWKRGPRLYRNDGRGNLFEITKTAGLPAETRDAFALTSLDFDADGLADIFLFPFPDYSQVALQLARPDLAPASHAPRVFRNLGKGRFEETLNLSGMSRAHGVMRAIAADFDRDGFEDLLLACGGLDPLRLEPSVVLRNQSGKGFALGAYLPDLHWPMRALGADVRDVNRDGLPDVVLRLQDGIVTFRNASPRR